MPFNSAKALGISGLSISGTGIINNSSSVNTAITPTISFTLGTSITSSDPLSFNFRGVTTSSTLDQSEVSVGGGCSGSPVLSVIPAGVNNPSINITGITCNTTPATIAFASGNLNSRSAAANYEVEVFTGTDYGYFYYYVGRENEVLITAKVDYTLSIRVYPEKRIPPVNHWMNQNVVEIRNVGSTIPLVTQTVNMDANGEGTLTSVDSSVVPSGNYDFAIKGYSHLRRIFTAAIASNEEFLDLTGPGLDLLAGDTSVVEDNYVNSLDLSTISQYLYTGNIKNDLNRDGLVNSLDLSNMSTNLYLKGEE